MAKDQVRQLYTHCIGSKDQYHVLQPLYLRSGLRDQESHEDLTVD